MVNALIGVKTTACRDPRSKNSDSSRYSPSPSCKKSSCTRRSTGPGSSCRRGRTRRHSSAACPRRHCGREAWTSGPRTTPSPSWPPRARRCPGSSARPPTGLASLAVRSRLRRSACRKFGRRCRTPGAQIPRPMDLS